MKNCLSRSAFVATVLAVIVSADASAQSISDIYTIAKQNDPKYLAMRSEYEATGFAVKEARASLLPTIAYQVGQTTTTQNILNSDNKVFASGTATYPTNDATLSITQPIFRLAAWRNWRQSQASEKQAAAAFAAAEQDLIMRTASAYLGVLAARDALMLARGEKDAIQRQLDLEEGRFKNGLSTKVNLYDARASLALKESAMVASTNDLADKVQALRELTGEVHMDLTPLPKNGMLSLPVPQDIEVWVTHARESNLLLEARRQAVAVAQGELSKRKAGYFPTLDLAYSDNKRVTGGSLFGGGSSVKTNEVALRLNIPLFEGGATSAQTGQAAKHYETALQDLERDERQVERQARAAYQGVVGGAVRVKALDLSVTSFESSRQLKEEGYKAGLQTVIGVLNASRDLYAARRDSAQSRYDFLLNTLRLRQAAGSLSEADLQQLSGQ
jgi:outer membrane protein